MPRFYHDQLDFHYLDRGSGQPVVFQHGLGGAVDRIFELIELPAGYRLLGLDSRGHGETRPLGPTDKLRFDAFADDVVALMDHRQIPQAVVGGTSMGAGVALNLALRYPQRVRGLVLPRPAWLDVPNAFNAQLFGKIAALLREPGPERGAALFQASAAYTAIRQESPDAAASLLGCFTDPRAVETLARLEGIPGDAPSRCRADWRRIVVPTLVLANRQDPVHPFEFGEILAAEIPNARLVELTPKSVSVADYTAELRQALAHFLVTYFPAVVG